MIHNLEVFSELDTFIKTLVTMGKDKFVNFARKGTIAFQTRQGMKYIRDISFVLDLSHNVNGDHNYAIHDPCKKEIAKIIKENKTFSFYW